MSLVPFSIGADPEVFCINEKKQFISAVGKFGGTKLRPKPIGKGCAVQEDNVAVEFNIPPATDAGSFIKSITFALGKIEKLARRSKLSLSITASTSFNAKQLRSRAAKQFGCEADFNAWTYLENPRPQSRDQTLRTAGGHIHIGWLNEKLDDILVARACDVYLAAPLAQVDPDKRRRELYGKAGAMRFKPYGLEYRVLSNYWLRSETLMRWVYAQTNRAIQHVKNGMPVDEELHELVMECVDFSKPEAFDELNRRFALVVPH